MIRRKFSFDNTQLRAFCKKFNENFEKFDSATALELHHDELERRWNKLVESFENCVTEDGDSEAAEDPSEITATFDEASKLWQECRVKLIEATQSKLQPKIHESTLVESTMGHKGASSLKLPPCGIQPFEGGYSNWPAFRDIFQRVIIKRNGLSDAQRLYHLRSKTRGGALLIVQRFELCDANFKLAWEALKNRFENTRILVHQQTKIFLEFKSPLAKLLNQFEKSKIIH